MRKEKLVGYVGLGLISLFPLLGAFQAEPSAVSWQHAAERARRSVLGVQVRGDSAGPDRIVGCAVVLSRAPLRAVAAGTLPASPLSSGAEGERVEWHAAYVDPKGEFTILEGLGSPGRAAAASSASGLFAGVVPLDPATVGDLAPAGDDMDDVEAVLVSPAELSTALWIGELRFERSTGSRPAYAGVRMQPLREVGAAAETASESAPSARPGIDPALRGAPFVTREGVVLGLYVGQRNGQVRAVPMALVREAVSGLARRAEL